MNFDDVYSGYLQDQAKRGLFPEIIRFRDIPNPGNREAALKYHNH